MLHHHRCRTCRYRTACAVGITALHENEELRSQCQAAASTYCTSVLYTSVWTTYCNGNSSCVQGLDPSIAIQAARTPPAVVTHAYTVTRDLVRVQTCPHSVATEGAKAAYKALGGYWRHGHWARPSPPQGGGGRSRDFLAETLTRPSNVCTWTRDYLRTYSTVADIVITSTYEALVL